MPSGSLEDIKKATPILNERWLDLVALSTKRRKRISIHLRIRSVLESPALYYRDVVHTLWGRAAGGFNSKQSRSSFPSKSKPVVWRVRSLI